MILAGDIGGTRSRFTLDGGAEHVLQNRDFPEFAAALGRFLETTGRPHVRAATFAVAGPVLDGRVAMTNLGWTLDEVELSHTLGSIPVRVVNDLEAAAHGILALPAGDLRVLTAGRPAPSGNLALIAAGTGLGEAILTWHEGAPVVIASEGGHADWAPRDETDTALAAWLGRTDGHVSCEDVVAGPAIVRIHEFLRDTGRADEPPELRRRLEGAPEPAIVLTRAAVAGEFPIAIRTLEVFVRAYGAEAGNLALKAFALGGVYVAGGIAPDLLDGRWAALFMDAFVAKGRYAEFMRGIPVRVVVCGRASLVGATAIGARLAR